jgi:hypothetical protein
MYAAAKPAQPPSGTATSSPSANYMRCPPPAAASFTDGLYNKFSVLAAHAANSPLKNV